MGRQAQELGSIRMAALRAADLLLRSLGLLAAETFVARLNERKEAGTTISADAAAVAPAAVPQELESVGSDLGFSVHGNAKR